MWTDKYVQFPVGAETLLIVVSIVNRKGDRQNASPLIGYQLASLKAKPWALASGANRVSPIAQLTKKASTVLQQNGP